MYMSIKDGMEAIPQQRKKELERAERMLNALHSGGVSDWDFYGHALDEFNKQEAQGKMKDELFDELEHIFGELAYEPSERGGGVAFRESAYNRVMKLFEAYNISGSIPSPP